VQENGATVLAESITDQQFDEISDDGPEIDREDGAPGSSETDASGEAATPKRGRGRPPKPITDEPAIPKKKFKYFPTVIRKTVGVTKEFPQSEFFKYWKKVAADPELRDRAVCYVYRTFPVTNVNPPGDVIDETASKKPKYLDCTSQPLESDQDVWQRYGAGDYKFYLNDADFPGRSKTQMCCYFQGTREWGQYPPQLDLRTLDMDDPKNKTYIRYLQQKGLMPKPGNEGDEEDMANVEVVREMASTVDKLTDKLISQADRPAPAAVVPMPHRTAHEIDTSNAVKSVTESFAEANRVQMQMLSAAVDKATAVQAKTQDPFDTLSKVIGTIRELYPKQDTSALERELQEARAQNAEMARKIDAVVEGMRDQRTKQLEAEIAQMRQQQQGQPAKDPITQLREFSALQREFKEILGGPSAAGASDEDDEKPTREPWYVKQLPVLLGGATFLMSGIFSLFHNKAVAATGQGQPVPPPPPPPELLPPGAHQMAAALVGAPPNGAPAAPTSMPTPEQQIAQFITMIQVPLERSLDSGNPGHDFAAWMADSYGDVVYQQVRQQGADKILGAVQMYAPALYAKMQQIPERTTQFITEFLEGPGEEDQQ